MHFDWSVKTVGEWREFLKKIPRSNCMQTWPYAKAVRMSDQKSTRMAVIYREDMSVGFMAIQEIKLGPVHFVNLYRGPLWFRDPVPTHWILEFTQSFNDEFPRRWFRRRRWLPEIQETQIESFKPFVSNCQKFKTAWLELQRSEEDLRKCLKQKWRNALNKSEKNFMDIVEDWSGLHLEHFIAEYQRDRLKKRYHGPGGKFVREEFMAAKPFKDAFLLWAQVEGKPVASIFIIKHGVCASYRIGWSTDLGRKYNAHNRLLWEAAIRLKEQGIERLDLGGLDVDKKDSGLNKFKIGTGAQIYETPGMLK